MQSPEDKSNKSTINSRGSMIREEEGRTGNEGKEGGREEGSEQEGRRRKQLVSVLWEESSHGDWREGERG